MFYSILLAPAARPLGSAALMLDCSFSSLMRAAWLQGSPLILSWLMKGFVKSVERPVGMPVVASSAGRNVRLATC